MGVRVHKNGKYRTYDGREALVYGFGLNDKHGEVIRGAVVEPEVWKMDGKHPYNADLDLIEVTLADELREQIPWEALRPHVKWVAMHSGQRWLGFERKPSCSESMQGWIEWSKGCIELDAVSMPLVDTVYWRETLMKRPE